MNRTSSLRFIIGTVGLCLAACADDTHHTLPDGGDADADTDSDSDTDTDTDADTDSDEWCPELSTSCGAPTALESCGDDTLGAPRLIFPLSGRHIRDRRPEIIWEVADGVTQYRLEIARDRAFTDVVYRSGESEPYPGYDDRLHHIVACDLDCGVHFFRVLSVTAPECEVGTSTYTWEMFVGMAPGDLDRDGTPDIAYWTFVEGTEEFEPTLVQAWAYFDLDEQTDQAVATKVVEFEVDETVSSVSSPEGFFPGDTNGDGYADLGLVCSFYEDDADYSTVVTRAFVFSGLTGDAVQTEADAVRRLRSTTGEEYQESKWVSYASVFRFSDLNGDGLPDLAFTRYNAYFDTGMVNEVLVLLSPGEVGPEEDFQDSAIHVACPSWCTPEHGMLPGMFFADVNGDGFGDLWLRVEDEAEYWHQLFVHGTAGMADIADPALGGTLISPSASSVIIDDWNLARSIETAFPTGDIDNDGYLEIAGSIWAFDHTEPEPVATFGFSVIRDAPGPGIVTYDEAIDFSFVSGFPVSDADNTEKLVEIYGVGDLDSDGIDDLFFGTRGGDSDPSRVFQVAGRAEWPVLFDVADESPLLEFDGFYRTIADVDGDAVNDLLYSGLDGAFLELSTSGEAIDWVPDPPIGAWYAFPTIY